MATKDHTYPVGRLSARNGTKPIYNQQEPANNRKMQLPCLIILTTNRHQRWIDTFIRKSFTHSSRKAWGVLNKITEKKTTPKKCPVLPNQLAKQLQENGRYPYLNRKFTKAIKKESEELKNRNTHSLPAFGKRHHSSCDVIFNSITEAKQSTRPGRH